MAKFVMLVLIVVLATTTAAASGTTDVRAVGPPAGLTEYGRTVWNLDALLHDTFGNRAVYLSIPGNFPREPRTFTTVQGADCCSAYYLATFRNARRSSYRLSRPTRPPRLISGASGGEVPLKIRGAFIYCGGNKWLFEHFGNGPANWQISCHT